MFVPFCLTTENSLSRADCESFFFMPPYEAPCPARRAQDTPLRTELTIPEAIQQGDIFLEEFHLAAALASLDQMTAAVSKV